MSAPANSEKKPMTNGQKWLIAYNSISLSLWSFILFSTVLLGVLLGQPHVFEMDGTMLIFVQSIAIFEVLNSILKLVRSPIFTTLIQVLSRLLIVYGVCYFLPDSPANAHWCYLTLRISWSVTEVIRSAYYNSNLINAGKIPSWLTWARYTFFIVLYPTGVGSEIYMIILSLAEARTSVGIWYEYFLKAALLSYIPGFYMLYTYMFKQRNKVLGKHKKAD